ncbi:MAG: SO_0444 family Cu/Zn efflux transporter [Mangrovibacterium sp.]
MIINFLEQYLRELIKLTNEMAPWLLLGLIFAGILKVFFPQDKVHKYMGKPNTKSAINAVLLGIPMPLCSCGVIPTGISFFKNGASRGATNSFLISTPQTGVDSIFATYSMLGLPFAILRPIIAFTTGIAGGILTNKLIKDETSPSTSPILKHSMHSNDANTVSPNKWIAAAKYAFVDLLQDIAKWLIIGLMGAALISVLIPNNFFEQFQNYGFFELIIVLLISIPMYICATGSIPIAAVLLMKGVSPGAALVFLMAGPATNVATITVIGSTMGKKSLLIYLVAIIGGALFFGLLTNLFIPSDFLLSHIPMMQHDEHGMLPLWLQVISSLLLIACIVLGRRKLKMNKKISKSTNMIQLKVEGMTCSHCEANVVKSLTEIEGITKVFADRTSASVYLEGEQINLETVEQVLTDIGYNYKGEVKS